MNSQEILDKVSYMLDIPIVFTQLDSRFKGEEEKYLGVYKTFIKL